MKVSRIVVIILFKIILIWATNSTTAKEQKLAPKKQLKILVYSTTIGWSHMQFLGTVADTLAEAGHDVHFLRISMNNRTDGLPKEVHKVNKIRNYSPKIIMASDQFDINAVDEIRDNFGGKNFKRFLFQTTFVENFKRIFAAVCQDVVNDANLIAELESEHFDVAIAESYTFCPFALFHRIGVKTKIGANAVPLVQNHARPFGIPTFSSYVTNILTPLEGAPNMNFLERIINFYNNVYDWAVVSDLSVHMEQPILRRAFGDDFPPGKEIARNISLLFVNTNQFFEMPRPISNKIINIGGIVEMKSSKLEPKILRILDQSKAGAVLFSFGTFVDTKKMSQSMKLALLRTFSHFPDYEFIWKSDLAGHQQDIELFADFKNVHTFKWIDQKSLLLHPRLRAFITHCGQNSANEAARAGVPMLAIPLFTDQLYNAILAKHRRVALKLDAKQLNGDGAEQLLVNALDQILNDPLYRENAKLMKRKLELSPFSAREKLIRWVEFASEFPDLNELNLPGENELGLFAYYSIDAILFSVAVFGTVAWILVKLLNFLAKSVGFVKQNKIKKK